MRAVPGAVGKIPDRQGGVERSRSAGSCPSSGNIARASLTTENLSPVATVDDGQDPSRDSRAHRLLRPGPGGALVGGVCAGVADYLEVEALVVRVCFVIVVVASGIGLVIYPLAWALIPARDSVRAGSAKMGWRARFSGWREAVGIAVLVAGVVLALRHAGLWLGDAVVVPLVLASSGLALILRQAVRDDWVPGDALRGAPRATQAERERRRRHWPPVAAGAVLIVGGAFVFLGEAGLLKASRRTIIEMLVLVAALSLVVGPSLLRLARSLANERSQRIRSQERADVAAHLHDSVLQTLALIQRRAGDPREVSRLARSQERELRHWLFEPGTQLVAETLATALREVAEDVEGIHGVRIEVVTVGDCALDERLKAMAAATREALTNAAKFAGEGQIDLYAEVDDERVQVFVRDHGAGFDPLAIPADRRGLRQSIIERMHRHGGRAEIDAQTGRGTEIELVMEQL